MGRKCSAFMCSKTIEHGVKLFQFPKNYTHNWIFAVDRGPTWTPNTNSRLCSDHFPEDAFTDSDKGRAMKDGCEPNPGAATSISEEQKAFLVEKRSAENLKQEELETKNKTIEIMSKVNPELWEVVLILKETEVEIQEFATKVINSLSELDLLEDNKIVVEKIINDIKTSQNKIEKYIMKGSIKKKTKIDLDQMLPKLEPGTEDGFPDDEGKSDMDNKKIAKLEVDASLYCESVMDMAMVFDVAKALNENGSLFDSMGIENEEENSNDYDNDYEEVICKKESKPRIRKPRLKTKTGYSKLSVSCKLCESEEVFHSFVDRNNHVLTQHGEPPYQCTKCDLKCETYKKLVSHSKNVHIQLMVDCSICKKKIKEYRMKNHLMVHNGERPHSCDVCGKSFTLKSQLRIHTLVHSGERPHKCLLCTNSYKQSAHLKHHVRSVHEGIKPSQAKRDLPEHKKEALKRVCNICGKILNTYQGFKAHERLHAGVKPYKCHICNKAFSQSNTLAIHLDSHKTTKDYSCEVCGNSFKHKISLAQHRKTHDKSLEKSLTCELCSMKFTTADNLKRHIRVTHDKIKLHSCDVCERSFGSNSEVRQHMRVHTGEKPYHCEICNKSFSQSSSLYSHKRKNHQFMDEK